MKNIHKILHFISVNIQLSISFQLYFIKSCNVKQLTSYFDNFDRFSGPSYRTLKNIIVVINNYVMLYWTPVSVIFINVHY